MPTTPAESPTEGAPRGGVRPWRFLMVTAPATVACLAVVAGIVLGYVSVAIAGSQPLDMTTSHGTGDSMRIAAASDDLVTGLDVDSDLRATAKITVESPSLDDLCLLPRVTLPLIGDVGWLRINSDSEVDLGSVVLAAGTRHPRRPVVAQDHHRRIRGRVPARHSRRVQRVRRGRRTRRGRHGRSGPAGLRPRARQGHDDAKPFAEDRHGRGQLLGRVTLTAERRPPQRCRDRCALRSRRATTPRCRRRRPPFPDPHAARGAAGSRRTCSRSASRRCARPLTTSP